MADAMDWNSFVGHERQRRWFRTAVGRDRLASSFLMVGPPAVGKRTFARLIAKTLLCQRRGFGEFTICGRCEGCAMVQAATHPDLIEVAKPPDAATFPIKILVGEGETRMREGVCYDIRLKPFFNQRRIAIIDDADSITPEVANTLLKTLEEPPAGSLIFLISTSEQRQLPTIRSRTQAIRFSPLPAEQLATLVRRLGWCDDSQQAAEIARRSDGTLQAAMQLRDAPTAAAYDEVQVILAKYPLPFQQLAKTAEGLLKSRGDDTQAKREALRMAMQWAIDYLRRQIATAGAGGDVHPALATEAILRTVESQYLVDRNLNSTGLIEAWASGLARSIDAARA